MPAAQLPTIDGGALGLESEHVDVSVQDQWNLPSRLGINFETGHGLL